LQSPNSGSQSASAEDLEFSSGGSKFSTGICSDDAGSDTAADPAATLALAASLAALAASLAAFLAATEAFRSIDRALACWRLSTVSLLHFFVSSSGFSPFQH
jgi:hypothetical protein